MDCTNINLTKGNTGEKVKQMQTLLTQKGYYDGKIDGSFGDYTLAALKKYQKANKLAIDGVFGPVTCKKLNTSESYSYYRNGIYHSGQHWIGNGCNKKGQCTSYFCACCAIRQQLTKLGIENYTQQRIAQLAGTTTAGTSHLGIETAIAKIAQMEGVNLKVTWKNFSDLGNTLRERMQALGKLIATQNIGIILHTLYKNRFGHYESIQEVNMNNSNTIILNSLGSKCNSPAFCGYNETRSWNTLQSYLRGISQKSICIITKE